MPSLKAVIAKIADLKAKILPDSVSPHYLGAILEEMLGYSALSGTSGNFEFGAIKADALEVAELIAHRITASDADTLLSEADIVTGVTDHGDGIYTLSLLRPWQGYVTAQIEHNIIRGSYSNIGGAADSQRVYARLCWLNVIDVDYEANTLKVRMYLDKDTPDGKNNPPLTGMRLSRWGNSGDTSVPRYAARQSLFMLSGSDGRISKFFHVTAPITTSDHTALSLGTFPEFIRNLDSRVVDTDDGLFADTVVARRIILLDELERPVFSVIDRGLWSVGSKYFAGVSPNANGAYERSLVWYAGHGWLCDSDHVASGETIPAWDSNYWTHAFGDPSLNLRWIGSEDSVMVDNPDITLDVAASLYNQDLTRDPRLKWEWTRESVRAGVVDTASDSIWNTAHANTGSGTIRILKHDMNYIAGQPPERLTYTATATLLDDLGRVALSPAGHPITRQLSIEI